MSNLSQDPNLCYWCRLVGLTPSPVPSYLGHMANTMIPQWTVHDRCRKARESAELDHAAQIAPRDPMRVVKIRDDVNRARSLAAKA